MKFWLGIFGLVFVALVVVSVFLVPTSPGTNATAAKVIAYYHNHKTALQVTSYLIEVAIFVGLFFFWYLRDFVAAAAGKALATIGFAGAVVFAVSGALSAGLTWAGTDAVGHMSGSVMQGLNVLENDLVFPLTGAGTAVFLFATGLAILRARVVLPVWLGWLAIVASVAALVVPWIGLIEIGVWLILTSIAILVCANRTVAPAAT
ncbi:MAG: hypothetical protein WB383_01425 [Acidimicrobiales bacterium]